MISAEAKRQTLPYRSLRVAEWTARQTTERGGEDVLLQRLDRLLEPYGDGSLHGKLLKRTRKQLRSVSSREALTVPFLFRRTWGAA